MKEKTEIILGPPGTGKTSYLVGGENSANLPGFGVLERLLAAGVRPDKIAYIAFTRRAAKEARARAGRRFGFTDADMPWFRTIHSLAFHQTAVQSDKLIKKKQLVEIGRKLGFEFKNGVDEDFEIDAGGTGDQILALDNLARITGRSLEETYYEQNEHKHFDFGPADVLHFSDFYKRWKLSAGLIDYTDAIENFVEDGYPPDVDYLIVDEAQDLSYMQWMVVEKIAAVVKEVYIAGDDDQAIFRWAGADVDKFLSLEGRETHLEQSYRVPARVHRVALDLVHTISRRRQKTFNPKVDKGTGKIVEGSVRFTSFDDEVPAKEGSWFFLARHQYQLKNLVALCEEQGWFYSHGDDWSNKSKDGRAIVAWESLRKGKPFAVRDVINALEMARAPGVAALEDLKPETYVDPSMIPKVDFTAARPWFEALVGMKPNRRDYFQRALGNGEKMLTPEKTTTFKEPRIRVSTIHGVKGGEADGVFLLTDVSGATADAMASRGADDEARVFYVGVTRAKERLVVKNPNTDLNFEIHESA